MKNPTQIVKDKYGETARAGLSTDDSGIRAVAEAFGYSAEELASIPSEANMGLSCGNPIATANLRSGEVVVGSGLWRRAGCLFSLQSRRTEGKSHRHRHDSRYASSGQRERH